MKEQGLEMLDLEIPAGQPVIFFRVDFVPSAFDRPVTEFFKEAIRRKLASAGIRTLLVIIRRDSQRQLFLAFEGATSVGYSGFRDRTEPLGPWIFEISFAVPRVEMISLLQIESEPAKYFEERLNGCETDV